MGLLIAGTIYRGEFESRLRQVMDEIARDPNIILFIDEIHNIVGAGANQGALDAGNILKPVLARGQLRCIGATTPAEFKNTLKATPPWNAASNRFILKSRLRKKPLKFYPASKKLRKLSPGKNYRRSHCRGGAPLAAAYP